jgi:site-specific DNA-methyltransferase (adenine-specific)
MNPYQPPDADESQLDRIERRFTLHHGDCLDVLKTLADCSIDAIVTDPPAGIAFMNREWDRDKGGKADWIQWMQSVADQCLRVIKPGGHALVWAIPRTSHWTGTAWEDAGWQPRDKIYHVFGSGFPKSLDVSKAIDKAAGAEREKVPVGDPVKRMIPGADQDKTGSWIKDNGREYQPGIEIPATEAAKQWEGWGTALKPAAEEWWLFRKPPIGTIAANVLEHGTGGLNIGACRVGTEGATKRSHQEPYGEGGRGDQGGSQNWRTGHKIEDINTGRWPANFIHDNSEEVLALFPDSDGSGSARTLNRGQRDDGWGMADEPGLLRDAGTGSAARFFYCAKASRDDRDEGCGALDERRCGSMQATQDGSMLTGSGNERTTQRRNTHSTVKPTDLMRYLCRLITPPNGIVLDPFTGSGSTGKAAMAEGFRFIGIEREAEYIEIARARISAEAQKPRQLSLF